MTTSKIEQFTRQNEEILDTINKQNEEIARLSTEKKERQRKIERLNQNNVSVIKSVQTLGTRPISPLDLDNKEEVLLYVQQQIDDLSQRLIDPEFEQKQRLKALLIKAHNHLLEDYDQKVLAEITSNSGIASKTNPPQKGFDLLLELIEENKKNYNFYTFSSTEKKNLADAISKKLNSVNASDTDDIALIALESVIKMLRRHKATLEGNYHNKAQLEVEIAENESTINAIETDIIPELQKQSELILLHIAEQQKIEEEIKVREEEERLIREEERIRIEAEDKKQLEAVINEQPEREASLEEHNIIAQEIKNMLRDYLIERNKNYRIKDSLFSSQDKNLRKDYIDELTKMNGPLDEYERTGDSKDLCKRISNDMDDYKGIKMRATLSRVIVKLIDAEPEPVIDPDVDAHEVLAKLQKKSADYVAKVMELYNQIQGIKVYAQSVPDNEREILNNLSDQLKKDVDQLVSLNPDAIPSQDAYEQFEIKFKARLHSQDDVMSEYKPWGIIAVNLLLNVVALAKFIVSKLTKGRATFFFDSTEKQQDVEANVDNALKDLGRSIGD